MVREKNINDLMIKRMGGGKMIKKGRRKEGTSAGRYIQGMRQRSGVRGCR